jgi:hypothetical protein
MTRDNARLEKELEEIRARFAQHEKTTRQALFVVIILATLALAGLTYLFLVLERA